MCFRIWRSLLSDHFAMRRRLVYLVSEDRFSVGAGGWASRSSEFGGQMEYRIQYRVQRAYHSLVLLLLVVVVAVVISMD